MITVALLLCGWRKRNGGPTHGLSCCAFACTVGLHMITRLQIERQTPTAITPNANAVGVIAVGDNANSDNAKRQQPYWTWSYDNLNSYIAICDMYLFTMLASNGKFYCVLDADTIRVIDLAMPHVSTYGAIGSAKQKCVCACVRVWVRVWVRVCVCACVCVTPWR